MEGLRDDDDEEVTCQHERALTDAALSWHVLFF
jgi:hypothetical protein